MMSKATVDKMVEDIEKKFGYINHILMNKHKIKLLL